MNLYTVTHRYMTTGMIDRNDPSCEVEAACCKVFGSEKSFEAINEAIQIMGGMGFMKVRDTHLLYRACPEVQLYYWVFTTVGELRDVCMSTAI